MTAEDRFSAARKVADAVLYEGYVLYPYRASSQKNQCRWQFGVVVPPTVAEVDSSERSRAHLECIVVAGTDAAVHVRIRCLQIQERLLERTDSSGERQSVGRLEVEGSDLVPWDEAVDQTVELGPVALSDGRRAELPFRLPATRETEEVTCLDGATGFVVRRRDAIDGCLMVEATQVEAGSDLLRLSVTVENTSDWRDPTARRERFVRRSLIAVHAMLSADGASFVSSFEPPEHARDAVAGCHNEMLYPVLIGDDGASNLVLASPLILHDYPAVAPESPGDLYDSTEIDEILALRVLTMTPSEKAEARATDARSAAIIDRCDSLAPEDWSRLHGTLRGREPEKSSAENEVEPPWWSDMDDATVDPIADSVRIGDVEVRAGTKVLLRPSRRADAHDMFLAGKAATVAGVFQDIDGEMAVAVNLDDDPATEQLLWHGRFLYFHPDEIEVVASAEVSS